jgi:hypothetical protein
MATEFIPDDSKSPIVARGYDHVQLEIMFACDLSRQGIHFHLEIASPVKTQ